MKIESVVGILAGAGVAGLIAHGASMTLLGAVQYEWNDSHSKALRQLGNANYVAQLASEKSKRIEAAQPKIVSGEAVYGQVCVACHQAGGTGLVGAFPPLAQSEWVTKDPRVLARIVLGGLQGPIEVKGQKYNAAMPAFSNLSDEEIAAVLTYIRANFGNTELPVEVKVVRDERASDGAKQGGWNAESVQAL